MRHLTQRQSLTFAVIFALVVRLIACWVDYREPVSGLEAGYLQTVAAMASGRGMLSSSALSAKEDVVGSMKEREAGGGRLDKAHPYPRDVREWTPATGHPPGYALAELFLYKAANYSWMVRLLHFGQALLDALTCLLLFVFVRNLFGPRSGLTAAWIYAVLPQAVSLTMQLLPDALTCFFAAAVLAAATQVSTARLRYGFLTGALIALAAQFRAEFILWLPAIVCGIAVAPVRIGVKARFAGAALAAACVFLTPWMVWTKRSTGRVLLTTTIGGGSMYEALGEDPANPWGIRLLDDWLEADAVKKGFRSAWGPEADRYYRAASYAAIREHPLVFLRIVALHRLPLALVPPYMLRTYTPVHMTEMTERRMQEGLSRWGVVWKYPGLVLRTMWDSVLLAVVSLLLLTGTLGAAVAYRHEWREMAWIVVPWLLTIAAMCALKQIEARNMAANLVLEVAASSVFLTLWRKGRQDRTAAVQPVTVSA